jgi:hypothetical protein
MCAEMLTIRPTRRLPLLPALQHPPCSPFLGNPICALRLRSACSARPAAQVSREVLEEVRSAKSTMNRLLGRVERVKQELEDILGDDADMQVRTVLALSSFLRRFVARNTYLGAA